MKEKEMNEIISENLQTLMREYKLTQKELSVIAGVSASTVGKWILQKSAPRMGAIQKIADHFDLPKSYILNEKEGNKTNLVAEAQNLYRVNRTTAVPIIGTIACGDPILANENIEEYRYEPTDYLPQGDVFYLRCKGDSMTPTIPTESLVLIRHQTDVESGEIAAVLLNGDVDATLKRVKKQGDNIILLPDNHKHDPIFVNEDNPARIIGKAMRVTHDL
ncbi:LexA family protein [Salimicrobium album]|uniref:Repressor LexA n=1 Tax=Salimicrobium album TaxID=50717 RepID=A0A1H3DBX9_9BACI|nr:XRE family transcriptional regulator [Salimicrobium album]SDX64022.1 repressor LexA [Salimicrobium album]